MALEAGTYVEDLVVTNPPGGDDKRQGDDHLRLIKKVLRNTFKRATKPIYPPGMITKSTHYTVLESDENLTINCDTGPGSLTLALPALDSTRFGWKIKVIKTNGTAPVLLLPPSGTISGHPFVRRSVNFAITEVQWVGVWVASRPNALPIGSVIEWWGGAAPPGHLLCDGAAVNGSLYPELANITSVLPNHCGRSVIGRDTNGGGPITGFSGIAAGTLGSIGGLEAVTLTLSEIPAHSHVLSTASATISMNDALGSHAHSWGGVFTTVTSSVSGYNLDHAHSTNTLPSSVGVQGAGVTGVSLPLTTGGATALASTSGYSLDHAHSISIGGTTSDVNLGHSHPAAISGSTQPAGSSGSHLNVQPSIVMTKIIVAE